MKFLSLIVLTLFSTTLSLAEEVKKDTGKHWYAAVGPAFSTSLLGTGGTKFGFQLGYQQGFTERMDLLYFYDASLNTASMGSTAITEIGAGILLYQGDRGADSSAFVRADVGYGGNNRYVDAGPMAGAGIGFEFSRTKDTAFQVVLRYNVVLTQATTNVSAYPNVTDFNVGVIF